MPSPRAASRGLARLLLARGAAEETHAILGALLQADPWDGVARETMVAAKAQLNARLRARIAAERGVSPEALPVSLRFIAIGTTGVCNASCIHCPTGKAETAHVPRVHMPMPLFERIVRGVAELHLSVRMQVSLGLFGDGLVDPLVLERVRLLRRLVPDAMISVNTNAAAYSRRRHLALRDQASVIAVHCESLVPETYDRLMAPLRLKNVMPKLEAILGDFPGRVHVSVPVSRLNRTELPAIRAWFEARGAVTVSFDALSSRCAEDRQLFDSLAIAPVPIRCMPEVGDDLIVDCDGRVTICCQDFRREEPIGDLSRETLLDTLLSAERLRMREQFSTRRHAERSTCSRCYGDPAGLVVA